jgi:hypothetical protein
MRTTSKLTISGLMPRAMLLSLLLGLAHVSRGEIFTPAQRELVRAERKLEAARARVTVTADQVAAAQGLRMARLSVFRACQTVHGAVERAQKEAEKAETLARSEAALAEQLALEAKNALERWRATMKPARERFLDRPLLAYDIQQHGKLTFNALTGAFDLTLEDVPGITLSAADLDALQAGRFQLPKINPLQLVPKATITPGRLTSNYDLVQASLAAEHGAGNVYLLSRRFLDWATPERMAGDFARASLASGLTVVGELALARRQIQLEYEDLASWLRLKGVKDLGPEPWAIVPELVRTGSYPRLGLSVKTRQVEYARLREPAGRTEIPADYLKRLWPNLPSHPVEREVHEKRPALAIVWSGPASSEVTLAGQLDGSFRLSPPAIAKLPQLLPPQTDSRIRRLLAETAKNGLLEIDASAPSRRVARAAIGLRKEDIETSAVSNRGTIDLRSSDFGEIVASFVSQLALGNRKSCDIGVLELDRSTGRLEAEFTLHHRHAWPSLREALAQLEAALGPVGTDVEDLADQLPDVTFDAARKLYHEADARAHEAGKQAYEAEQRAHDSADRIATKKHELATIAGELTRAQTDLQTATERERLARQEAQAACILMLELDAKARLTRNRARGLERSAPANPVVYGRLDASKKW